MKRCSRPDKANLEQERLELQALNSERFRHRFLERNRPWILQHLTDLLTPRTLQQAGPDGQVDVVFSRFLSRVGFECQLTVGSYSKSEGQVARLCVECVLKHTGQYT